MTGGGGSLTFCRKASLLVVNVRVNSLSLVNIDFQAYNKRIVFWKHLLFIQSLATGSKYRRFVRQYTDVKRVVINSD